MLVIEVVPTAVEVVVGDKVVPLGEVVVSLVVDVLVPLIDPFVVVVTTVLVG